MKTRPYSTSHVGQAPSLRRPLRPPARYSLSILAFGLFAAFLVSAAAASELRYWSAAQLRETESMLSSQAKGGFTTLADFGTHNVMLAVRHGNGQAEQHERMADVFVVRSGNATLVTGGEMVDAKDTGPGEKRGSSITGGSRQDLAPGDVVHIPAGVPHQVLMKEGDTFSYLVVKAAEK